MTQAGTASACPGLARAAPPGWQCRDLSLSLVPVPVTVAAADAAALASKSRRSKAGPGPPAGPGPQSLQLTSSLQVPMLSEHIPGRVSRRVESRWHGPSTLQVPTLLRVALTRPGPRAGVWAGKSQGLSQAVPPAVSVPSLRGSPDVRVVVAVRDRPVSSFWSITVHRYACNARDH